jgi:hypothetical protein
VVEAVALLKAAVEVELVDLEQVQAHQVVAVQQNLLLLY